MLCELKVENLAIIESLHLNFDMEKSSGLVVMTGETGAGKSIMLRAIKMLTGGRAQADWVRSGAGQCTVEALFEVDPAHLSLLQKLEAGGYGDEPTVIIKRIVSAKGRSRIYINGSLATAKAVRGLTDNLLNLASQHDHQQLLQPHLHLDFLDTLGEHWPEREVLTVLHKKFKLKTEELSLLKKQEQDLEQKKDFLSYQVNEIQEGNLYPGEDEELAVEKKRLKNADNLIKLSQESYSAFSATIVDELNLIRKNVEQIALLDQSAAQLTEELSNYCFQAEDVATQLRRYRDSLESDPYRLEKISERVDLIQSLKRKYGDTIEVVLAFAASAQQELKHLENYEVEFSELKLEVTRLEEELFHAAKALSAKRRATAQHVEEFMTQELSSLAFNNAGFEVRWQATADTVGEIGPSGMDKVEFYFSANPGEPARPLAKVASGGELSRLMLALKCLLARKDMVETVIFDEVDAGVGGEAAEAVARKIQELASHHQVFCITHLPQIAARGTDHYVVEKSVNGGRTLSSITLLSQEERENEVARMLAGESATRQTYAWAKELLDKSRIEWEKI